MSLALDVAGLVATVAVIVVVVVAYRRLLTRLAESDADRDRRRQALTEARDALRARTLEVALLRSEWPRDVEVRFPDDDDTTLTVNGLPCARGLRGCDFEAVRERPPGAAEATVLYLRLPSAPPDPTPTPGTEAPRG